MSARASELATELWAQIAARPEAAFWVGRAHTYRYDDLARGIRAADAFLGAAEVSSGHIVVIVTGNDWVAATTWLACVLTGRIPTIVAPDAGEDRLQGIVSLTEPALIVVDAERADESWATVGGARRLLAREAESLMAAERATSEPPSLGQPSCGTAYILFTSGTTAEPKGVVLSHDNLHAQLKTISRVFAVDGSARLFNGLVLFHVDGIVQGPVLAAMNGATLLRPAIFSSTRLEDDLCWLRDHGATHVVGVPTLYAMIDRYAARDDYFDRDSFRSLLSTSAALDPELWDRLERRFKKPVVNEYGMTETVAATHFAGPHSEMGGRHTIGRPIDCEAQLRGASGEEVPRGEVGELHVRGPCIFQGYFRRPEATRAVLSADGWFATGDLCRVNADGDYCIVGRKNTAINCGGFLIRPEEIDEALRSHPSLREAQTIGLPDPDFGTIAVSAVVSDRAVGTSALMAHCRVRLESQKIPKRIVFVPAIPRVGSGKPDLAALRALVVDALAQAPGDDSPSRDKVLTLAAKVFDAAGPDLSLEHGPDQVAGWDSYSHMVLTIEAERAFGVKLSGADVMAIKTLGDLASLIDERTAPAAPVKERPSQPILQSLRAGKSEVSLVALPDIWGRCVYLDKLLPHLDEDLSVLGIEPNEHMLTRVDPPSIAGYAEFFVRSIRASRPTGPLVLIGHSFGGYLAYEVAAQLGAQGRAVEQVVLLDTSVPMRLRKHRLVDRVAWLRTRSRWQIDQASNGILVPHAKRQDVLSAPGFLTVHLAEHPASHRMTIRCLYQAMTTYEPTRYAGAITIIRAKKSRFRIDPGRTLGWEAFASGPIDVFELDGDHLATVQDAKVAAEASTLLNRTIARITS